MVFYIQKSDVCAAIRLYRTNLVFRSKFVPGKNVRILNFLKETKEKM